MKIPEDLYYASFPTGSNYICNPPVVDTDIDTMYYVRDLYVSDKSLILDGWTPCSDKEYKGNTWKAYRKGKYNAIITADYKLYVRFEAATELAKKYNLLDKDDRIEIFSLIIGNMK